MKLFRNVAGTLVLVSSLEPDCYEIDDDTLMIGCRTPEGVLKVLSYYTILDIPLMTEDNVERINNIHRSVSLGLPLHPDDLWFVLDTLKSFT